MVGSQAKKYMAAALGFGGIQFGGFVISRLDQAKPSVPAAPCGEGCFDSERARFARSSCALH